MSKLKEYEYYFKPHIKETQLQKIWTFNFSQKMWKSDRFRHTFSNVDKGCHLYKKKS